MNTLEQLLDAYLRTRSEKDKRAFFEHLFLHYYRQVFAIARSRCQTFARDIASEVFLKLLKMDPVKFSGRLHELDGLINRATYNLATDYYRRYLLKGGQTFPLQEALDSPLHAYDPAERQELADRINLAVATLSQRQRNAFHLLSEGYSYREIADRMHARISTVRSLLQHARTKLREQLRQFS